MLRCGGLLVWLVNSAKHQIDDLVRYGPASEDLHELVEASQALYVRSPDAVLRLIMRSRSDNLVAFADAFRFRKD